VRSRPPAAKGGFLPLRPPLPSLGGTATETEHLSATTRTELQHSPDDDDRDDEVGHPVPDDDEVDDRAEHGGEGHDAHQADVTCAERLIRPAR
jgi:hypothetical protein